MPSTISAIVDAPYDADDHERQCRGAAWNAEARQV
jgi:hypothetical protein